MREVVKGVSESWSSSSNKNSSVKNKKSKKRSERVRWPNSQRSNKRTRLQSLSRNVSWVSLPGRKSKKWDRKRWSFWAWLESPRPKKKLKMTQLKWWKNKGKRESWSGSSTSKTLRLRRKTLRTKSSATKVSTSKNRCSRSVEIGFKNSRGKIKRRQRTSQLSTNSKMLRHHCPLRRKNFLSRLMMRKLKERRLLRKRMPRKRRVRARKKRRVATVMMTEENKLKLVQVKLWGSLRTSTMTTTMCGQTEMRKTTLTKPTTSIWPKKRSCHWWRIVTRRLLTKWLKLS